MATCTQWLAVCSHHPHIPCCVLHVQMDIVKQFSLLGWIAFGGPAAHIGLFQKCLVDKLRWMSDSVFMELFALGQCLPGPSSTQVSFAIGTVRKGVLGECQLWTLGNQDTSYMCQLRCRQEGMLGLLAASRCSIGTNV